MSQDAKSDLAPTGVLRAGINLSNFLLVTGKSAAGDPEGVAPLILEGARQFIYNCVFGTSQTWASSAVGSAHEWHS